MSVVEQTLGEDPGNVYDKMDFATRDRYRHVVEKICEEQSCTPRARWRARRSNWRMRELPGKAAAIARRMSVST